MDPSALLPVPDAIPVGWGWFQLLLTLTFFLHIVAMNVMLGLCFIAFVHHFSGQGHSLPLTREIAGKLPYTIAIAVNFGIAPLLFVQVIYGHLIYVSSILMGVFWLSIVGLLIVAYYSAYTYSYRYTTMRAGRMVTTGITLLCLLAIGFFLSTNMTMMLHPESWSRYFNASDGFLLNLADPTQIPRYLHFVLSAVAVAGLAIALFYRYRQDRGDAEAAEWITRGCYWFAGATFLNFGVGFWFFGALPQGLINASTAVGFFFSLFLIIGMVTGALAVIAALRFRVVMATAWTLGSVLAMVLVRDFLRIAYLKPWFSPSELIVHPAWSPFLLFLLFFAAGLVLVGWMLKITWDACMGKEVQP